MAAAVPVANLAWSFVTRKNVSNDSDSSDTPMIYNCIPDYRRRSDVPPLPQSFFSNTCTFVANSPPLIVPGNRRSNRWYYFIVAVACSLFPPCIIRKQNFYLTFKPKWADAGVMNIAHLLGPLWLERHCPRGADYVPCSTRLPIIARLSNDDRKRQRYAKSNWKDG